MTSTTGWQAALHLLTSPALAGRVESFYDSDQEIIYPEILEAGWSSQQLKLIELAMGLSSEHQISLKEALDGFDTYYVKRIINAMLLVALPQEQQLSLDRTLV